MPNYIPTIGLEIHAELKTKTKMFCDCVNDPDEKHPNTNVCPICLGHPGTLPVPNKAAIEAVILVGNALSGDVPMISKFDRKNYFYPDLPKGYQISQYDVPLVFGGILNGVQLERVHLEEDTGRLVHTVNNKKQLENNDEKELKKPDARDDAQSASLVDFNRAGVPLMELVTKPDIRDANQAVQFAKELQLILRYLEVSDADMEKGQMRVEANVSVRQGTSDKRQEGGLLGPLGTKVEVKNINSFKAVHDAIEYEIRRQSKLLESGEKVIQETRGWDEGKKATVSQRKKEEAHDYRYFPEPDIPPLDLMGFELGAIKKRVPELPQAKRVRFIKQFNLVPESVEVLIIDRKAAQFFEETISELQAEDNEYLEKETQLVINYLTSDLRGIMIQQGIGFKDLKVNPENFADLIELISHGKLSSRAAKNILIKMVHTGGDPHEIIKTEGLEQVSDESELLETVKRVIEANPGAVEDFMKGKENAVKFLIGRTMAELKGRGNPEVLGKLVRDELRKN